MDTVLLDDAKKHSGRSSLIDLDHPRPLKSATLAFRSSALEHLYLRRHIFGSALVRIRRQGTLFALAIDVVVFVFNVCNWLLQRCQDGTESQEYWGPAVIFGVLSLGAVVMSLLQWRCRPNEGLTGRSERSAYLAEALVALCGLAHMAGWFSGLLLFNSNNVSNYEVKLSFAVALIPQAGAAFLGVRFSTFGIVLALFVGYVFAFICVISPIEDVPGHAAWYVYAFSIVVVALLQLYVARTQDFLQRTEFLNGERLAEQNVDLSTKVVDPLDVILNRWLGGSVDSYGAGGSHDSEEPKYSALRSSDALCSETGVRVASSSVPSGSFSPSRPLLRPSSSTLVGEAQQPHASKCSGDLSAECSSNSEIDSNNSHSDHEGFASASTSPPTATSAAAFVEPPASSSFPARRVTRHDARGRRQRPYEVDDRQLRILEKVAAGSSGQLFRAEYGRGVGVTVAVKEVFRNMIDPSDVAEIRSEAKALSRLNHPCVVRFYGVCAPPGHLYLVMEYCPISLQDLIEDANVAITYSDFTRVAQQVASAMAFLHAKGLVHRDLKPTNVLLDRPANELSSACAKLCDFGLAQGVSSQAPVPSSIAMKSRARGRSARRCIAKRPLSLSVLSSNPTNAEAWTNDLVDEGGHNNMLPGSNDQVTGVYPTGLNGTPGFAAPEQLVGESLGELSTAVDVYAFAMLLWCLFTRRLPYEGLDSLDIIAAVIDPERQQRPPLSMQDD